MQSYLPQLREDEEYYTGMSKVSFQGVCFKLKWAQWVVE